MTSSEYGEFMSDHYIHKLRSFKDIEHIKKKGSGPYQGFGFLTTSVTL